MSSDTVELVITCLLGILVATTASTVGLLSVWAAWGRGHWFVRLAVVLAVLSLGMAIPAYDLILMFFTQAAVVVLPLLLLRPLRAGGRSSSEASDPGHPSPSRAAWPCFGLRQLFLAIVLAGGLLAIPAAVPKKLWAEWFVDSWGEGPTLVMLGASLGAVTLAAAWAALGRRWTLARWSLLCLLALMVGVLWRLADSILGLSNQGSMTESWWLVFIPAAAALTAAELALVQTWMPSPDRHRRREPPASAFRNRPTATRIAGLGATVGGALILLPQGFVYYHLVTPTPIPPTRIPTPNAYDELVELGTQLGGERNLFQGYISAVDDALKRHTIGLPKEDTQGGDPRLQHKTGDEEVRRFVAQHQPLLDRARLALARESVVPIDYFAFEPFGENPPDRLQDLGFAFAAEGTLAIQEDEAPRAVRSYVNCIELARAMARCDLAIRSYRLERGKLPGDLRQLVPDYLAALPEDPFSRAPLVYRLEGEGYILYSVGVNRTDEGGRPGEDGDLLLSAGGRNR